MPPTNNPLDNTNNYFTDYTNPIFNNNFFSGFVTGVLSTVIFFSIFRKKS
jgi:hypothetical protein